MKTTYVISVVTERVPQQRKIDLLWSDTLLSGGKGRRETPARVPGFHSFTRAKAQGKKISLLPACRDFTPSQGQSTREEKLTPARAAKPQGQELKIFVPECFARVKEWNVGTRAGEKFSSRVLLLEWRGEISAQGQVFHSSLSLH